MINSFIHFVHTSGSNLHPTANASRISATTFCLPNVCTLQLCPSPWISNTGCPSTVCTGEQIISYASAQVEIKTINDNSEKTKTMSNPTHRPTVQVQMSADREKEAFPTFLQPKLYSWPAMFARSAQSNSSTHR